MKNDCFVLRLAISPCLSPLTAYSFNDRLGTRVSVNGVFHFALQKQ